MRPGVLLGVPLLDRVAVAAPVLLGGVKRRRCGNVTAEDQTYEQGRHRPRVALPHTRPLVARLEPSQAKWWGMYMDGWARSGLAQNRK